MVKKPIAWRQRAAELYDLLLIHQLGPPVPALAWLPWQSGGSSGSGCSTRRLLFGTAACQEGPWSAGKTPGRRGVLADDRNYLCVASVSTSATDDDHLESVQVVQRINHAGPVFDLAYIPSDPNFVATATAVGEALVFDLRASPQDALADGKCRPSLRVRGHKVGCRTVAWSPHEEGLLLSGAMDGRICLWDVVRGARSGAFPLEVPLKSFEKAHPGPAVGVLGATFHPESRSVLASVGMDGRLCMWDTRTRGDKPASSPEAHKGGASCLAFAPCSPAIIATGGRDQLVRLWDMRQPSAALHKLEGHGKDGDVLSVAWVWRGDAPLLASSGRDRRVLLWDPRRAGRKKKAGDPFARELVFIHDAHEAPAPALAASHEASTSKEVSAMVASADGAGTLQVWQVAESLLEDYWQDK